jgi:hypothetical protein
MSTKIVTATVAVAALGIVAFFALRGDDLASRAELLPEPSVKPVALVAPAPPAEAAVLATRSDAGRPAVVDEPVAVAAAPDETARRVVLRGSVVGTRADMPAGLELLVRAGIPARVVHTQSVSGDGPFVIDLTDELPGFDPRSSDLSQRVSVLLVGDGYAESGGWAQPVDEGRPDEFTLSVVVAVRPIVLTQLMPEPSLQSGMSLKYASSIFPG